MPLTFYALLQLRTYTPTSSFTSINDLEITLTTEKTIYNYTEPIRGTVTIYYKTGEPFKGTVQFSLKMDYFGSTSGYDHSINGERNYQIGPPAFRHTVLSQRKPLLFSASKSMTL